MRSVLIMFATREGQTAKVARRIAAVLTDAGVVVRLLDARDRDATDMLDLDDFDLLVFGGSMHAGGLERELIRFINDHAQRIGAAPRSFFLVLLSAATRDPGLRKAWLDDARRKMDEQLAVTFEDTEMVAGALRYSRYPLPLRWMMRRIARKAGGDTDTSRDYEYTDWRQVEGYARRLAGVLRAAGSD
jgi:menaquinone-dependent protoporphyrinogen oxidase